VTRISSRPPRDSFWRSLPCVAGVYRQWLTDRGSLTRRIESRLPGGTGMTVKVIFQGRRRLHRDERFLSLKGERAFVLTRDVALYCGATPVVYAHSVLAPGDRGAGWRLMQGMGSRPLGAALFTDPRIRRLMLRQHKLGRGHELYRAAARIAPALVSPWARRSLFIVGKSPILVTEVFLPEVLTI